MTAPVENPAGEATPSSATVRRGFLVAAWAAVAALLVKDTTQPVQASTGLLYDNDTPGGIVENVAEGPTDIYSNSAYTSTQPTFTSYAFQGNATTGLAGINGAFEAAPMPCGVFGSQNKVLGATPVTAGVVGTNKSSAGNGVLGRSPYIGVRGEVTGAANGFAVFAVNGSSYQAGGPGTGGWGVYASSQFGHALVGASLTPGAAGFVGSNNSIAGAYAGLFYGPVIVSGDFTVTGAKSAAVAHPDGTHRRVYCVESPESWFEDFGKGQLECGQAHIAIDPNFAAVASLDDYHVFLTAYDADQLLHVAQQTTSGFVVRAKDDSAAGRFSWRIVAKRKDIPAPRFDAVEIPSAPEMPPIMLSPTPRTGRSDTRRGADANGPLSR
jgi:hypothetical protein